VAKSIIDRNTLHKYLNYTIAIIILNHSFTKKTQKC